MKSAKYRVLSLSAFLLGLAALPIAAAPASDPNEVDISLVIATDVSYSVDENENRFQREGAIAAFRSPELIQAIKSGSLGRIAVTYLDFSSYASNRVVVNWQIVHDKESAEAFADILAGARRTHGVQTSISSGIEIGAKLLEASPYKAARRVIDVSGDGPNNDGRLVDGVRDEVIAKGIVINGLPIVTEQDKFDVYYLEDLDRYYAGCVIGGPGAFLQVANGFEDLARAVRRKLILEISGLQPEPRQTGIIRVAANVARPAPKKGTVYERGCDIGERMRYGAGPARGR
ncbi:MAG: DUF1194 domain-containing protein [Alphaproteobacteria bacterium]|nr:DUF1194 domain-containing protein [Alphaproteobacteria bacterium]